jgi:ABC-type branched-subunit amino acid transport system substrate-binding protein
VQIRSHFRKGHCLPHGADGSLHRRAPPISHALVVKMPNFHSQVRLGLCSWASLVGAYELKLGYLYIFGGPGPSNGWGNSWVQESFSQFKLGIQDVNANATILPGINLTFQAYDDQGEEAVAAMGAVALTDAGVVGVVGTGYSSSIHSAAVICSGRKIPMISPGSTSLKLVDKSAKPYFMRSIASDGPLWKMGVAFAYDMGWRRVGVLNSAQALQVASVSAILKPALEAVGIAYTQLQFNDPVDANSNPIPDSIIKLEGLLWVRAGVSSGGLLAEAA